MKIGVLYCCYDSEEHVHQTLKPWVDAKNDKLLDREFVISAVSVPFKEYKDFDIKIDDTVDILEAYNRFDHIQYLVTEPKFIDEATASNLALKPLLDAGCDAIILVDADEYFAKENIENILRYIETEKFISWFSFSYKNYVFDEKTYLTQPFTPPRLFKVNTNGYKLDSLFFDNDFLYKGTIVGTGKFEAKTISYKDLPSKNIPAKVSSIKHLSWISNEKSRLKCIYQNSHFAHGAGCSFAWDDTTNSLIWNKEFFAKTGQSIPETLKEI